jgi:hypothetical protein
LSDTRAAHRFVTHVHLPLVRWRIPLPAPMPATWVPAFVGLAYLAFLTALVAATSVGHTVALALLEALVTAWLVGRCFAPLAHLRLRREAFSVLRVRQEPPVPQ